jgi:hypothetical protein
VTYLIPAGGITEPGRLRSLALALGAFVALLVVVDPVLTGTPAPAGLRVRALVGTCWGSLGGLAPGREVRPGEILTTRADGRLDLEGPEGQQLSLGPGSECQYLGSSAVPDAPSRLRFAQPRGDVRFSFPGRCPLEIVWPAASLLADSADLHVGNDPAPGTLKILRGSARHRRGGTETLLEPPDTLRIEPVAVTDITRDLARVLFGTTGGPPHPGSRN